MGTSMFQQGTEEDSPCSDLEQVDAGPTDIQEEKGDDAIETIQNREDVSSLPTQNALDLELDFEGYCDFPETQEEMGYDASNSDGSQEGSTALLNSAARRQGQKQIRE